MPRFSSKISGFILFSILNAHPAMVLGKRTASKTIPVTQAQEREHVD